MTRKVEVIPYSAGWPAKFEAEARALRQVFGEEMVSIHHFGSTAIPGISAKPTIDMLVIVRDIDRVDVFAPLLEAMGYHGVGEYGISGRRFFYKGSDAHRSHHLHIYQAGSPQILRHLAFRDYMCTHPAPALDYGRLKEDLARRYPEDMDGYIEGKNQFVKDHEKRAMEWWQACHDPHGKNGTGTMNETKREPPQGWIDGSTRSVSELTVRFGIPQVEIDTFHPCIRIYPMGETIIEEGSQDKVLFLLRFGRVGIYRRLGGQPEKIATIEATNFVGEMSLINDEPRSATVTAETGETLVYAITRPNLSLILSNAAWAELLVSRLSKNLNETNLQYAAATRSIQDLQVELERLRKEVQTQERAARQILRNAGLAFGAILYYQNLVRNLSVVGSKGWMHLKVLSEATRALIRHYLPRAEVNEEAVDPLVLRESLASIQQPGQGNILEEFYHGLPK